MNNPINAMCMMFRLTPWEAYLLLTVPRFEIGAAGGATRWTWQSVRTDLMASIAHDDTDRRETLSLVNRLLMLPIAHIGWFVIGARAMKPAGEVFPRPGESSA